MTDRTLSIKIKTKSPLGQIPRYVPRSTNAVPLGQKVNREDSAATIGQTCETDGVLKITKAEKDGKA